MSETMTLREIKQHKPYPSPSATHQPLGEAKKRMHQVGVWKPNQILGRGYPIGCVALEITQRCNLDCTICYLSEVSEAIKDIPMAEIFRRIDEIYKHYGPRTDVQITGGDPTLRQRDELITIVRRVKERGMCPTLMTNGIAATRDLLIDLRDAGLIDVAFHVDLTQERKGFHTETQLNEIRKEYIERARGLGLHIIFNTTIYEENFSEIPTIVDFFRQHTDVVGMASFQLQADTGRGTLRTRDQVISLDTVMEQIEIGARTKISFDTALIGHPKCHRYGLTMEANGKLYDMFDSTTVFSKILETTKKLKVERSKPVRTALKILKHAVRTPAFFVAGLQFILPKLWRMKKDLFISRGKVRKLSFFIQNFMDASNMDPERIHACSFMIMTPLGPMSMCMHNAKRDQYLVNPIEVQTEKGKQMWDPFTGKYREESQDTPISPPNPTPPMHEAQLGTPSGPPG